MQIVRDQLDRTISLPDQVRRIISLVPSQTELLSDLGLSDKVAGITKFCVHPPSWKITKTNIGGTKNLNLEIINQLSPDLIIANKEENEKEQVLELAAKYPVWISDVKTLPDSLDMINRLGAILKKPEEAHKICDRIKHEFGLLDTFVNGNIRRQMKTAYLIWRNPFMSAGTDTFIHDMMSRCGLINVFSAADRYPVCTVDELKKLNTEIILLATEPYPFSGKHVKELQAQIPSAEILIADGEMFSWYGSRLMLAPQYFISIMKKINFAS